MEKNQKNLQPKEEQQENCRTESLYLHLLSPSLLDKFSVFYKIDSSSEEPNFTHKPKLIPLKARKKHPHIGFGSAICDSNLYLFGGWMEYSTNLTKQASYLDLVASTRKGLQYNKLEMNQFRSFPITVTMGKNIYIFGSQIPGYGEFPSLYYRTAWAEVFNTEDKLFRLICPPPSTIYAWGLCIGVVAALIEKNEILMATENFSDVFIYAVETDHWTHASRDKDTLSPFPLCSMRSPVVGNKYIFLYGSGKICAFDIDKNLFLKNNISLWEYTFFYNKEVILEGDIHHRGGWKFSVVFSDRGYLVRFVYVVSFEIENPECCGGELKVKAGTMNIVDHVLRGDTFIDSFLWSNQIVPSGNPNNGKQSLKSNLIVGGSSVTSHVVDYGTTSIPELRRMVAGLSKLQRKEAALDKEMFEMRLENNFLVAEIRKLKKDLWTEIHGYDFYMDSLRRMENELSLTNIGETRVKNENVSETKTKVLLEISSTWEKVEDQMIEREKMMTIEEFSEEFSRTWEKVKAQMIERKKMMSIIGHARDLVRSCLGLRWFTMSVSVRMFKTKTKGLPEEISSTREKVKAHLKHKGESRREKVAA